MREACRLIWSALVLLFRSRSSLAAEILVLRHQINILRRHSPQRQTFSPMARLYRRMRPRGSRRCDGADSSDQDRTCRPHRAMSDFVGKAKILMLALSSYQFEIKRI